MVKEVVLMPLDALVPHEKTSKDRVQWLKNNILETSIIKRPLIVDENTYTVIDGHHRLEALRQLGARYAPVVLANYSQDIESIGTWTIFLRYNNARLAEIIDTHVKRGPSTLIIIGEKGIERIKVDAVDAYHVLHYLFPEYHEKYCNSRGVASTRYLPKGTSIVLRPRLTPYDITRIAVSKEPLPPKSTKHITYLKKLFSPVSINLLF